MRLAPSHPHNFRNRPICRDVPTIIACAPNASDERASKLEETGCEIVRAPEHDGRIDLRQLMGALGKRGIDSVFIEGGATLAACASRPAL